MGVHAHGPNLFRQARVRRGLSLADIAARTRISPRHLQGIDQGRFAELPSGIYARAYVRAFAAAVGLEAAAVDSVLDELPREPDPIAVLGDAPRTSDPEADTHRAPRAERSLLRYAAAACDTVILFALCGALVLMIARVCGTSVETLLDVAGGATGVLCGFTSAAYFVLLAGVDGRTAGAWLCHVPHSRPAAPLDLTAVVRRGAVAWVDQASIVVDLLLHADYRGLGPVSGWIDLLRRYSQHT